MDNTNPSGSTNPDGILDQPTSTGAPERIFPIIGVEFKGNRRNLFNNPMEFPFKINDLAVVRVEKGEDLGSVVHLIERLPADRPRPECEVLRRATAKDIRTLAEYRAKEEAAKVTCKEKIANHGLLMKLVDVEYQFDGRKLTFFFTADGRIDFRQLVKDLAATFRTRIELKQIGARDEIRRFGGLGPCGRPLCCSVFIHEFCPITTQMAKDQNLPLNPSKISGCCGRLKCCLQHELDEYREALKVLPRWDTRLQTSKGPAQVEKLDVFSRTVFLRYPSGDLEMVSEAALKDLVSSDLESAESAPDESAPSDAETDALTEDDDSGCSEINGSTHSKAAQSKRRYGKYQQWHPRNKAKNSQSNENKNPYQSNPKGEPKRSNSQPK